MLRNLTLKQIAIVTVGALVLGGALILAGTNHFRGRIDAVNAAWSVYESERAEKSRLELTLRATLGYGGLVHSYKNYLLRQEEDYFNRATEKLGAARAVLDQYAVLGLTPSEEVAVQDLRSVLTEYGRALSQAAKEVALGLSSERIELDYPVDDTKGIRALAILRSENLAKTGAADLASGRVAMSAKLRAALGYGGMIHAFKNYVILKKDEDRLRAEGMIANAKGIIEDYRKLALSPGEAAAIQDIERAVNQYERNLSIAADLVEKKASAAEIDKAVRVDDSLALRGLMTINREIAKAIELSASDISTGIHAARDASGLALAFIAVGTILLCLFLIYVINRHLIVPVQDMTGSITALAGGDLGVSVSRTAQGNEIGAMARAVEVFRDTSIRRREAEQALAVSNEELSAQLAVLRDLRDRTEQQAAQAVALAENLTRANEEASKASARAEADEFRIRSILQTVTDAIITIDATGIVETFNSAAERIFGYHESEVIGRNVSMLMPDPHRSAHDGYIQRFLDGSPTRLVGKTVEQIALRNDGSRFPIDLSVNPMRLGGQVKFTGVARDITDRKEAEAEINRLALTDPLTGLANRNQFSRRLNDAFKISDRQKSQVALLLVDLDKFKPVNDIYGHPAGDALLKLVADEMLKLTRDVDTVARLGGDEFAILLFEPGARDDVSHVAERIVETLGRQFDVMGFQIRIGGSVGIAFHPSDASDQDALFKYADLALYAAKAAGRNTYKYYNPTLLSSLDASIRKDG
ncbi:MAG: diguanylate cyclase [Rhodospirillales bacterium]|nr:diguanylate cyclase [Rhodospirillales bacterium]